MSGFSALDLSPDPDRLIRYLEVIATGMAGIKHYTAAAHALRRPELPVLDIGCGAGHDLALLGALGVRAIGMDPSQVALRAADERARAAGAVLVRGRGEQLPFAHRSLGGARMERVLIHADDPTTVLRETVRCVVPGGLITAFEPDWSTFVVRTPEGDEPSGWISGARHPDIGGQLWELLEALGCEVQDQVTELSVWRGLKTLERVASVSSAVPRAVATGRVTASFARGWLARCQALDAAGQFSATISKRLVVATTKT